MQFNKIKALLMSHTRQLSQLGSRHLAIFGSAVRDEATEVLVPFLSFTAAAVEFFFVI